MIMVMRVVGEIIETNKETKKQSMKRDIGEILFASRYPTLFEQAIPFGSTETSYLRPGV